MTLLVRDYDEALVYFTEKLAFDVLEDRDLGDGKRWVVVRPSGAQETALLLARQADGLQESQIGLQAGGRVCLFLYTDDFWCDYSAMLARGVRFREAPRQEAYGTVAVFEDLYGNRWDLVQPA